MRNAFKAFLFVTITLGCSFLQAEDKPFRRVYVLDSGSTYDTGVVLGVLNGLEKEMTSEDLILATNASSLAAAIFLSFPDKEKRVEYLKSESYFKFLSSWAIDPKANASLLSDALKMKMRNLDVANAGLPTLVGAKGLQQLPDPFVLPEISKDKWTKAENRPALMLLATRVNFDPKEFKEAKEGEEKEEDRFTWMAKEKKALFTVLAYSDAATNKKISESVAPKEIEEGLLSVYNGRPSSISPSLELRTLESLHASVRKSLANPPLFGGVAEKGEWIVGGVSQHDPVDLALVLARDGAVVTYSGLMGEEASIIKDVYNYDINEYRGRYAEKKQAKLIQMESLFKGKAYKKVEMGLKVGLTGASIQLPKNLATYQKNVQWLSDQGEALVSPLPLP